MDDTVAPLSSPNDSSPQLAEMPLRDALPEADLLTLYVNLAYRIGTQLTAEKISAEKIKHLWSRMPALWKDLRQDGIGTIILPVSPASGEVAFFPLIDSVLSRAQADGMKIIFNLSSWWENPSAASPIEFARFASRLVGLFPVVRGYILADQFTTLADQSITPSIGQNSVLLAAKGVVLAAKALRLADDELDIIVAAGPVLYRAVPGSNKEKAAKEANYAQRLWPALMLGLPSLSSLFSGENLSPDELWLLEQPRDSRIKLQLFLRSKPVVLLNGGKDEHGGKNENRGKNENDEHVMRVAPSSHEIWDQILTPYADVDRSRMQVGICVDDEDNRHGEDILESLTLPSEQKRYMDYAVKWLTEAKDEAPINLFAWSGL